MGEFFEVMLAIILNYAQVQGHAMLTLSNLKQVNRISRVLLMRRLLIAAARHSWLSTIYWYATLELRVHKATACEERTGPVILRVLLLSG